MNMIGRNSSLFKGEPVVSQPVRVENASADLLNFYRAHKARSARLIAAARKVRQDCPEQNVLRAEAPTPEPEARLLPKDLLDEVFARAMALPLPTPASDLSPPSPSPQMEPGVREIQRLIATHHGIAVEDLFSPRRTADEVITRQLAMFCVWAIKPSLSLPDIGRRFGNRDHTTILHAVRKICKLWGAANRAAAEPIARQMLTDAGYIWPEPKTEGEGE